MTSRWSPGDIRHQSEVFSILALPLKTVKPGLIPAIGFQHNPPLLYHGCHSNKFGSSRTFLWPQATMIRFPKQVRDSFHFLSQTHEFKIVWICAVYWTKRTNKQISSSLSVGFVSFVLLQVVWPVYFPIFHDFLMTTTNPPEAVILPISR